MARWSSAWRNEASDPVVWVAYGDSITEGQGASARADRWIDKTVTDLRASTGVESGGVGYLPGWYAVYAPDSPWQPYTARTGGVSNGSSGGLGLRNVALAPGASQTYQVYGTSAELYYDGGGGLLDYNVDHSATTTLDTSTSASTTLRHHIAFPSAGTHVLAITARDEATTIGGVAVFDGDEDRGLHLFDNAHSGYTSTQFEAAEADLDPIVTLLQPDLVTIELGANDYLSGTASPSQVASNLRGMVSSLRARLTDKPPSIVLVIPYQLGLPSDDPTYTWDDYVVATRALGDELSVGVLDMSSMGTSASGGYWSSDALHPSDAGHAEMARLATAYLTSG